MATSFAYIVARDAAQPRSFLFGGEEAPRGCATPRQHRALQVSSIEVAMTAPCWPQENCNVVDLHCLRVKASFGGMAPLCTAAEHSIGRRSRANS
jgi:hypothetical protein